MNNQMNVFRGFRSFNQEEYFKIRGGLNKVEEKKVGEFLDIFESALSFYVGTEKSITQDRKVISIEMGKLAHPEFDGIEDSLMSLIGQIHGLKSVEYLLSMVRAHSIDKLLVLNDNFYHLISVFESNLERFKQEVVNQIRQSKDMLDKTFDNLEVRVLKDI